MAEATKNAPANTSNTPEKKEQTPAGNVVGALKTAKFASQTISAGQATAGVVGSVSAFNTAQAAAATAGAVPLVGGHLANGITSTAAAAGAKDIGTAVVGGVQSGVQGAFSLTPFGMVLGGGIALVSTVGAVVEVVKGEDIGQAFAGLAGKYAIAGISMLGVSGLALIPELATKFFTGKSITERIGEGVENATLHVVGQGKDSKPKIKEVSGATVPATAAVVAGGIGAAGLAANQVMGTNGKPLTLGAAPKLAGTSVALSGQPVIPKQVMPVQYSPEQALEQSTPAQITQEILVLEPAPMPAYGKDPTYWRDRYNTEKQGRMLEQQAANANDSAPRPANLEILDEGRSISKADIEMARRQVLAQNPNLALTGAI
jgi:hypothetical protein